MGWDWGDVVKHVEAQGRFYYEIVDNLPIAVATVTIDRHIVFANKMFCKVFHPDGSIPAGTQIDRFLRSEATGKPDELLLGQFQYAFAFHSCTANRPVWLSGGTLECRITIFALRNGTSSVEFTVAIETLADAEKEPLYRKFAHK